MSAGRREPHAAQRRGCAPRDVDDGPLRHLGRLTDRQPFGGARQVRRIGRAHRDRADERAVGHVNEAGIARAASVTCHDAQIAAQRPHLDRRDPRARIDRQRLRPPRLAGHALRERDRRTAGRADANSDRLAAQDVGRQVLEREMRQQRALPRADRLENRQHAVVEVRHREDERGHRHRRGAGGLRRASSNEASLADGELPGLGAEPFAQCCGGSPAKRAGFRHFDDTAQRSGAKQAVHVRSRPRRCGASLGGRAAGSSRRRPPRPR